MPLRSSGCFTCRKRKIRCDETRPHCKRCGTHGVPCPGYRTDKAGGIEFKDQTTDTVKRATDFYRAKDTAIVRKPPALQVTSVTSWSTPTSGSSPADSLLGEDFLRGYFNNMSSLSNISSPGINRSQLYSSFMGSLLMSITTTMSETFADGYAHRSTDVYLPRNLSDLDHFSFFHTLVDLPVQQPALVEALDALSLVAVGSMNQDRVVLNQSVRKYGNALSSLGKALARPETAGSDDTLAAATVLASCALYDEIGKQEDAWGKHVIGGQQLIATRGPETLKSKLALLLFSNTRHGALIWALIERKAPYMARPDWRALAFEAPIVDNSTMFYDSAIQIPGLLQRFDQLGEVVALSPENIDELLRDCDDIEHNLREWFLDWKIQFALQGSDLYQERSIDEFPTFVSRVTDRTFETAFMFDQFPIAYLTSVYWLSMYYLRFNIQSLHKVRHDLDRSWFPDSASAVEEEELSTWILNLCRCIPFFCEPISSSTGHVGMFLPLSTAAGYFIQRARWREAKPQAWHRREANDGEQARPASA
ncbi:hypothetical protein LTR42_006642 [Elasticomyces elasticus]|nr:hypothetical protein LTR42_006642 [Elasticomyces elasticus]